MKLIVRNIMLTCIGAVLLLVIMTVMGRMNRSMEIKSSLSSVAEGAVGNLIYDIDNREEFVSDATEYLSELLDTDSDIVLDINIADKEKKALAVEVTEEFSHPNGEAGSVSCARTVILNKTEEPEKAEFKVRFYQSREDMLSNRQCYKAYRIQEGNLIPMPAAPQEDGKTFAGWIDINGNPAVLMQPVTQNTDYYAEFH